MTRCTAAIALVLATACAENAVLEVSLVLPAQSDACGAVAVGIEARIPPEGSCFFDQQWDDGDREALSLEAASTSHDVSFVAYGADVERPLCVRIRACSNADLCPPPDVAFGARTTVEVDRAFYRGQYTALELDPIDPCASSDRTIDPCAIEGCAGGAPLDTFCDAEGRHLCE